MSTQSLKIQPGQSVPADGLRRVLDILTPEKGQEEASLYLPPGPGLDALGSLGSAAQGWRDALAGLDRQTLESDTGLAALRSGNEGLVVVPPFPLTEQRAIETWDTGPLLVNVYADHNVGVGAAAVGPLQRRRVPGRLAPFGQDRCPLRKGQAPRRRHIPEAVPAHPGGTSPEDVRQGLRGCPRPVDALRPVNWNT